MTDGRRLKLWEIRKPPQPPGKQAIVRARKRASELAQIVKDGCCADRVGQVLVAVAQTLLNVPGEETGAEDFLLRRLRAWSRDHDLPFSEPDLAKAADGATDYSHQLKADPLGKIIGLKNDDRVRLDIRTIGPCDLSRRERNRVTKERRKYLDRERKAAERRAAGKPTRESVIANSAQRTKPWIALGMDRSTYYRRRKACETPTSTLLLDANSETSASTLSSGETPASAHNPSLGTNGRASLTAGNVPGLAHAGETGNSPARVRQSEPPPFGWQGKSGANAEPFTQPPCSAEGWRASAPAGSAVAREPAVEVHSTLSPNRDSRPVVAKGARAKRLRAEQAGQLNWLSTRVLSLGQPVRAASAGAGRAEASVPPRAAAASKLSPEVFRRMAKLQRWGIPADRVTAWHRHVSDAVLEELFATAVRRNRGPSDAREWLEEQMQCAMSDPHYESPARPERRRRQAKLVLATYEKSGARVLTRGGIAKLLEEMGEAMRKDQLGPLLGIMASDGSLILMSRGRYRRPDAEQQSEAPSSSKREMAS